MLLSLAIYIIILLLLLLKYPWLELLVYRPKFSWELEIFPHVFLEEWPLWMCLIHSTKNWYEENPKLRAGLKNVSGLHTKIFLLEQWIIHHSDLLSALELFGEKQPGLLFHAHCTLLILGKYIWKTNITCLAFIPLVHLKIQRSKIKKIKLNWKRLPGSQNVCKKKAYLLDALAQPTSILTLSAQCYFSWASLVYWVVF